MLRRPPTSPLFSSTTLSRSVGARTFFLMIRRPPRSPLFPSTTLFRSVDALGLALEQLPKVLVAFRPGVLRVGLGGGRVVHVAQRVDVLRGDPLDVFAPPPADADASDVERVARRPEPAPQHVPGHDGEGEGRAGVADERASRDALACHD